MVGIVKRGWYVHVNSEGLMKSNFVSNSFFIAAGSVQSTWKVGLLEKAWKGIYRFHLFHSLALSFVFDVRGDVSRFQRIVRIRKPCFDRCRRTGALQVIVFRGFVFAIFQALLVHGLDVDARIKFFGDGGMTTDDENEIFGNGKMDYLVLIRSIWELLNLTEMPRLLRLFLLINRTFLLDRFSRSFHLGDMWAFRLPKKDYMLELVSESVEIGVRWFASAMLGVAPWFNNINAHRTLFNVAAWWSGGIVVATEFWLTRYARVGWLLMSCTLGGILKFWGGTKSTLAAWAIQYRTLSRSFLLMDSMSCNEAHGIFRYSLNCSDLRKRFQLSVCIRRNTDLWAARKKSRSTVWPGL